MLFIWAFGMTLNMVVLFSLILALGMLVDNGIVLVENIYRHVEEGKTLVEASIDGTKEVALAVTASTATTVAAFVPLVFWNGIMGEFMGYSAQDRDHRADLLAGRRASAVLAGVHGAS